jgi:hypothetical protein
MWNLCKIPLFIALCGCLTACDEFGWNPLDPDRLAVETANRDYAPPILLEIAIPTLNDSASFFDQSLDAETGLLQRRRTWRGPPDNDVAASLMEIRALSGESLGDPPSPMQATEAWEQLSQRRLDFQTLFQSTNAIGPVLWRRFLMGPSICVAFSQGWAPDGGEPTRHLMGYYCAASGDALSDGQAETVVRSVRLREGNPDQSPDG